MKIELSRKSCCVCDYTELIPYRKISGFPVYMGTTDEPREKDVFFDQNWGSCFKCGALQLTELVPLETLYSKNHSTEAVGETWKSHHAEFATFISASNPQKILEIGGAHGDLAKRILAINSKIQYTFIEPSPGKIPTGCDLIVGYIEDNLNSIEAHDGIVHSHVLEHLYSPAKFITDVANKMRNGTKMFVSFPNIEQLLKSGGTNSLNFEHTYFLTPEQFEIVCLNAGLELSRQKSFRQHSFFWELTKVFNPKHSIEIPNIEEKNALFDHLWDGLSEFVEKCNSILAAKNRQTYVFGAHVFTQGMISMGLDSEEILGVLDNALDKQGKRLYGTKLWVFNPNQIRDVEDACVILRATHYQEEIKSQLLALNPRLEVIE